MGAVMRKGQRARAAQRNEISGLPRQAAFIARLPLYLTFRLILCLSLCLTLWLLVNPPLVVHGQDDGPGSQLPAGLCGLVNAQVACYDVNTAAASVMTPDDQRAVDFSIAPGGEWLVYRLVNASVVLKSIAGAPQSMVIDNNAAPPVEITPNSTTLCWSPDGIAIAYVVANGLRISFPPMPGLPAFAEKTNRAYINLRFSPRGTHLAAQSDDGSWSIFIVNVVDHTLTLARTIEQPGEVAWFDERNLAVALLSGGLLGENADDASQPPAWTVPNEHFIKMMSTSSGQVVAIHPDPGDTIGSAVTIGPDGAVTALGDSKVDSRVRWGPDGNVMLYIVTGTPILVDRATGAEDMLPVRDVSRVVWAPPLPHSVASVTIDSDLYYLAPDEQGIRQVWRLTRNGGGIRQITAETVNIDSYALSSDKAQLAYVSGGRIIITTFANMNRQRLIAVLPRHADIMLHWKPDSLQLAYSVQGDGGGLYMASTTLNIGVIKPTLYKSLLIKGTGSAAQLRQNGAANGYRDPRFSPDGRYLLVATYGGQPTGLYRLIDLQKPSEDLAAPVDSSHSLMWAVNNLLMVSGPATSGPSLFLSPVIGGQMLALAGSNLHTADVRITADSNVLFLRSLGWFAPDGNEVGPETVELQRLAIQQNGTVAAGNASPSAILPDALISPSGKFAAGLQHGGTIDQQSQLLILDVQTGQVIRLQGANRVSALQWVD